jgi:hypothetical protein
LATSHAPAHSDVLETRSPLGAPHLIARRHCRPISNPAPELGVSISARQGDRNDAKGSHATRAETRSMKGNSDLLTSGMEHGVLKQAELQSFPI